MKLFRSTILWMILVLSLACTQGEPGISSPQPADAPRRGGEFRLNMQTDPDTIDPNRANFSTSILVGSLVFEGLLSYDKDLKLVPGTAREVPTTSNGGISQDGLTYTFKLRPDAKWSDGQQVKGRDFVYAIKRSLDPKLAAPYAHTLYDIVGAQDYNKAKDASEQQVSRLRDAVAVTAPDDQTVVIKLTAPRPTFTHLISLWVAWPVRQDVIEKLGESWTEPPNYVGNGPFVLTRWSRGERMEFARNDAYHGQKPHVEKLTLLQMSDLNQAYLAYQNGELDATPVPEANAKLVMGDPRLAQESLRNKELVIFGYQFNVARSPFNNAKVRQALAMAVDRQALIERVAQGIGTVAYSPVPAGMPGHQPDAGKEFTFSVEQAKRTLAEAGYSSGADFPRINFSFTDTSANRIRAEFFQGQMKQNLGIEVTLEPLESRSYQQRFNNNQFEMVFGGWGADYPDPDNFVPELFKTGSGNNHTNYSNQAVDQKARECQSELDEGKRLAACGEAQKLVVADQPWIFLFYRERFWLVKPYVHGFQVTAKDQLPGNRYYHHVWLDR